MLLKKQRNEQVTNQKTNKLDQQNYKVLIHPEPKILKQLNFEDFLFVAFQMSHSLFFCFIFFLSRLKMRKFIGTLPQK